MKLRSLSDAKGKVQSRDRNRGSSEADDVFKATRLEAINLMWLEWARMFWTPNKARLVEWGRTHKEIKKLQVHWLDLKSPDPHHLKGSVVMFPCLGLIHPAPTSSNNKSDLGIYLVPDQMAALVTFFATFLGLTAMCPNRCLPHRDLRAVLSALMAVTQQFCMDLAGLFGCLFAS